MMKPHMHRYKLDGNMTANHKHRIYGYTESVIGIPAFHFHYFHGISSYNGHTHYYSGFTGFNIKTEHGHKHRVEGILESNNLHEHRFSSFTMEDIAYHSDGLRSEAYV